MGPLIRPACDFSSKFDGSRQSCQLQLVIFVILIFLLFELFINSDFLIEFLLSKYTIGMSSFNVSCNLLM